ncbi:photosystem I reaction center subunit XII, partial [Candidatus Gracilibacteria bacterium]|nr:photosystem I reaction center subunit XII [Candidatus Gracilibacteria bacterium]
MDTNFSNFNLNLELSLEQQFQMRLFENSIGNISLEQAQSLLLDVSRLLMVKDNIIRGLIKQDS